MLADLNLAGLCSKAFETCLAMLLDDPKMGWLQSP